MKKIVKINIHAIIEPQNLTHMQWEIWMYYVSRYCENV
jgi:hypothetical protein